MGYIAPACAKGHTTPHCTALPIECPADFWILERFYARYRYHSAIDINKAAHTTQGISSISRVLYALIPFLYIQWGFYNRKREYSPIMTASGLMHF
jgi:hypothetical protein